MFIRPDIDRFLTPEPTETRGSRPLPATSLRHGRAVVYPLGEGEP